MIEINYFKVCYYANDVADMLNGCRHDIIWLDADVDNLHVNRNGLNNS
jgi:hypothetical protein